MKKLLFSVAIFSTLLANAQNYLITFAGTGASAIVNSVKVENLTANTSLTLSGSDILRLTGTVGISQAENEQLSGIKIYPNPMTENSLLEIYPPVSGDATISVYEITGKPVFQIHSYLENFRQEFRLSGIKNGFYLINVKGNTYQSSGKLLCNGKSNGTISIEKVNTIIQAVDEKISKKDNKRAQATVEMPYSNGDRIKFTGISGIYSTVITDIPAQDKTVTFNFISCTDADNNNHAVVQIGIQVWMAENLKTIKYNDGTAIPLVPDGAAWAALSTPGYCWYGNESANKAIYGALYNWYTVNTGKLCPTGWHMPTDAEWTTLENYLIGNGYNYDGTTTGNNIAKSLASTTGWTSSTNTGVVGNTDYPAKRNATGFTGLPGGYRGHDGGFYGVGFAGFAVYWWSATELDGPSAWGRRLYLDISFVIREPSRKKEGCSVRCLKDI